MEKLRVLVLTQMYPRPDNPTDGIFVHHQVRHLKQEGCELIIVSPIPFIPRFIARNKKVRAFRQTPRESVIDGVQVFYPRFFPPPTRLFHFPTSYALFYSIKKMVGHLVREFRPHLLHAHRATPDGYAGLLLKRKFGLRLVISLRGSDVNVYPYRDWLTYRLTKAVISGADKVTAVSNALKAAAEKIGKPEKEIAVILTGCDLESFSFNKAARIAFRKSLNIPLDNHVLIFSGRLLRAKGVFELLKSLMVLSREHSNLHLIFLGSGKDEKVLKSEVVGAGVKERVHFVGDRPHDEVPGWLSAADILVLPSWGEGLPNVVVEAMACERPVVATRVGGIPQVVEDGETGILVDKGDMKALADAIAFLIVMNKSKRRLMGVKSRQIVEKKFTWERSAKDLYKIYNEVLSE